MKRTLHWLLIAVSVIGLCACGDDDTQDSGNGATVEVSTKAISEITATTAVCGGVITGEDGASVSARGVCWSKSSAPTTSDFKTSKTASYIMYARMRSAARTRFTATPGSSPPEPRRRP